MYFLQSYLSRNRREIPYLFSNYLREREGERERDRKRGDKNREQEIVSKT